jgi:hypothetical protein
MGLFLVLFWYSAVFRRIYFPFRPAKFPIGDATGIGPQGFDSACPSRDRRPAAAEKSTNFPVFGRKWDQNHSLEISNHGGLIRRKNSVSSYSRFDHISHRLLQQTVIALRRCRQNGQLHRGGSNQLRGINVRRMLKTRNINRGYANLCWRGRCGPRICINHHKKRLLLINAN